MNFNDYELIIFDLDGTLAPSKSPLEPDMVVLFGKLIAKKRVAVISGGTYAQFETQFLQSLPHGHMNFTNLYLLPTSGTRLFVWRGHWVEQYAENFTHEERDLILNVLEDTLKKFSFLNFEKIYGIQTEDRGSQITWSALGQKAPLAVKSVWDPDLQKRNKIAEVLRKRLPRFDIRLGGTTSIDITKKGVNKAYGIRKLEQYLKLTTDQILFVGDALYHSGNDSPVKATGVDCLIVKDQHETADIISTWLKNLD